MLTWIGFLAKITEAIVTGLAKRKIEWSLDHKRQAARGLVDFLHALEEAESQVGQLITIFDQACATRKPVRFSKDLVPFENWITRVNDDLRRSFDRVGSAIYIVRPDVSNLLTQALSFKSRLLSSFGNLLERSRFKIEHGQLHPFDRVSFTVFDDAVLQLDIDSIAEAAQRERGVPGYEKLVTALVPLLREDEFSASDFEKVAFLRDRLVAQRQALAAAIEGLRQVIRDNFNISDLL